MNTYVCHIDLKQEAKSLAFASALTAWMTHLREQGTIEEWRLSRRKLNLAAAGFRDFLLEVDVTDLAQLDQAFRLTGQHDDTVAALHRAVHDLIESADFGLYRPYPDPERAERMALL